MNLPPGQAELIQAVVAANPRTVVVLNGGSPSVVTPWIDDAAALVMYWYGGTEGGNGLARVLFGDVNPAGKLPCSWPKQLTDSPAHASGNPQLYPGTGARGAGPLTATTGPQQTYSEGILVGYRWFDEKKIEPQFPFGFGLSYTTFNFGNLAVNRSGIGGNAQVTLTNTGPRDGATVAQLYVQQNNPKVARPPRELKGFAKVTLKPGETKTINIPFDASSFAYYDVARKAWIADAGEYTLWVGDSSRNLPLKATFQLPQEVVIPDRP